MTAAFFLLVLVVDLLAVIFQSRCEPLSMFFGARVLIFPVILAYGAMALPLAGALALAFVNGLLWDALTIEFLSSGAAYSQGQPAVPEFTMGWSVVLFGVLTLLMHGFRPLFVRGRWELHCLASGLCASAILLAEYLMITFRRGGFLFPQDVWARIFLPGFFAMLMAPVVCLAFRLAAALIGHRVRQVEVKGRL